MARLRLPAVNELSYRTLVWLTYRLAATFALGLPLVLLVWSALRREASVLRLLTLYWISTTSWRICPSGVLCL